MKFIIVTLYTLKGGIEKLLLQVDEATDAKLDASKIGEMKDILKLPIDPEEYDSMDYDYYTPIVVTAPKNICSNCNFDMGDNYENCGASEDGVCPECGKEDEETLPEACAWDVPVMREAFAFRTITVNAKSEQEAIELAIDEAGSCSFSEKSAEYTAPDGASKLINS